MWNRIKWMPAANKVTALYQLIMIGLIVFNFPVVQWSGFWIAAHLLLIGIFIYTAPEPDNGWQQAVRFWNPLLVIFFNFSELHYLIHPLRPHDVDSLLIQLDHWIFGLHPTVWMEKIQFAALTEYLQLVYSSFYFLPLILVILLLRRKQNKDANFFVFVVVYGFYFSYLGYFMMPAIGPRFTLSHLQSTTLQGLWLTPIIRHTLDTLENIQRDAFPSGHTMITVLTMFYAWIFHRKYFWWLLPVGLSLIFSTVYLRYHYVVDVLGGIFWAAMVVASARPLFLRIRGRE